MSTYFSFPLSGSSSFILDNKLVKYGKIANRVLIENSKPNTNIKNKKIKTLNTSMSLLQNNAYNRFLSIHPTVIYSLKKR